MRPVSWATRRKKGAAVNKLTRRTFTQQSLGSLVTFSLLESLCRNDLFADEIKPITVK
jgi:hypothetical protein